MEVISPAMTIKVAGFLKKKDGLKSIILNKIKDTFAYIINIKYLQGQKNYILVPLAPIFTCSFKNIPSNCSIFMNHQRKTSKKIPLIFNHFMICKDYPTFKLASAQPPHWNIKQGGMILLKSHFHSQVRAKNRIGPHNNDVISVIFGLLLGDGYAINRSGEGVRISIKQSIKHKDYLFSLYDFFLDRGYCSNNKPRLFTRIIKGKDKIYYGYEFNTFTFRSFV